MSNFYWVAPTGSVFNSPSNWSLSSGGSPGVTLPGSSDSIYFDASGQGDCTFNVPIEVASLQTISHYSSTLLIDSTASVWGNMVLGGGVMMRGSDGTISVFGDLYCNPGYGEYSNRHNAVIRLSAGAEQNIFTDGGILPCLMVDKTTSDLVNFYGVSPLKINGDFIIEDGTVNTRDIDLQVGLLNS